MKNHRRKRRKKGKTNHEHAKENSIEADEINPQVKEMKPGELQFNLVPEDHYSLYERTSIRGENRKEEYVSSDESVLDKEDEEANRVIKGQRKSTLPPLKELERNRRRKRLTFAGTRRASRHSILDTKPDDVRNDMKENSTLTYSESHKKLASVSFVGIYDLDDMSKTETKQNKKLDGILKSSKQGTEVEIESAEENTEERVKENSLERTKGYVIQTLTLEGESLSSKRTLFQDKFILPGIKENALSTRSNNIPDDEYKTTKRRERLYKDRESDHRLPRIVQRENRHPKMIESSSKRTNKHRGKLRSHDNSFEQVYLERNIPRLPLVVNGRMTQF